jgi:hypothetical protein
VIRGYDEGGEEVGDEHQGGCAGYALPFVSGEEIAVEVPAEGADLLVAIKEGEDHGGA